MAAALAPSAMAAVRKAEVRGVTDRGLAAALVRAVGDERRPPDTRLEARRRAQDAAESATALLRSEGYYDAVVTPEAPADGKPRAVITVAAGPRTTLEAAAITYEGAAPDAEAQAAAAAALALAPGAPALAAEVISAEGRAVAALAEHGYADAVARPRKVVVDHATHGMAPTYVIAAGARVRLDGLKISSTGRTDLAWVRGLRPWRSGATYRPGEVAELERRLTDTQAYDTVAVALSPVSDTTSDGLRPVVVSLADRRSRAFDLSAGYSTSEGADFDVFYHRYNQLRRGDTLTLEARLAELDSRVGGELALPHFLTPGQTLTPSLYAFHTVTDAYDETGAVVGVDLTQRFGTTSFLTRGVSLTDSRVKDKELGGLNLVALRLIGAFSFDRTDNALDPHRGYKADLRVVPTFLTGDEDRIYARMVAQASGYLGLGAAANDVIAVRGRVGSIVGAGSVTVNAPPPSGVRVDPGVPAQDRFFAGGGGSVRGYEYQGVGPFYPDGTPRGGLSLVETSIEWRHRFGTSPIGAVVFIDGGSVGDGAAPTLSRFETAVGIGARYSLGFAPVRADFAIPLQRPQASSQQPFQIYLSIGQSF